MYIYIYMYVMVQSKVVFYLLQDGSAFCPEKKSVVAEVVSPPRLRLSGPSGHAVVLPRADVPGVCKYVYMYAYTYIYTHICI